VLGLDAHAVADNCLASAEVGSTIDLHHAIEADAHIAKEPARLPAPASLPPFASIHCQQRRSDGLSLKSKQPLPIKRNTNAWAALHTANPAVTRW